MRTIVQRVLSASVSVEGEQVSSISQGLLCLVGICREDTTQDIDYTVNRILNLRLWPDGETNAAWKTCVKDLEGQILCVSQFTLYGSTNKNKPDFHRAMAPSEAKEFYDQFLQKLRAAYVPERTKDGKFGAMMQVSLVNDGPVTMTIDSRETSSSQQQSRVSTPGGSDVNSGVSNSENNNNSHSIRAVNKARRREEFEKKKATG